MTFPANKTQRRPTFNPRTRRAHRGEVFWQIWLPLFAGVLVSALLFYLLLTGGAGSIQRGAQVAIILLALPTLLLGAAMLALLLVLNHGIGRVMNWLPPQAARVQQAAEAVNAGTQKSASAITRALMKVDAWGTAARKVFNRNR